MEIQIPLVLFVAFCAVSAGIFATQAILALRKEGEEAQMPALITSLVALIIGGVAVLFHLAQPMHIFNGFGNPTSGITQELVVIVVLVIVMLVYFIMLRRNDGAVPAWCAILAIVVALALDIICAHSYMMAARPTWNSVLQICSVVGLSCAVGPAAVAAIAHLKKAETGLAGTLTVIGTIIALVTTVAYVVSMASTGSSFTTVGTYIDPTNPTAPIFTDAASISPFVGAAAVPTWIAIIASVVAVVLAFVGKKTGNWKVCGTVIAVCALVAGITLRVTFYVLGVSVYNFYGITG